MQVNLLCYADDDDDDDDDGDDDDGDGDDDDGGDDDVDLAETRFRANSYLLRTTNLQEAC